MSGIEKRRDVFDPMLITGLLPLLTGARSLASGLYMASTLLAVSLLLQVLSALLGRFLGPWPWKNSVIFLSSVLFAVAAKAIGVLDAASALSLSGVLILAVFSGAMRSQYRNWSEDLARGKRFDASRLLPVLLAAALIAAFGAIREILGSGSLSLPVLEGGAPLSARIFPFSVLPSLVMASSAGALLLAGYAAAAMRLARGGPGGEENSK